MGVYQKLGIRNMALQVIDSITWIRQYGLSTGFQLKKALSKATKGFFKIEAPFFKDTVFLRDNFSDKAIFYQVFYEQQYGLPQLDTIQPKVIIDAGANIGLASIYFANLFPEAVIIALEPEKDNYDLLKKNTAAYKQVTTVQKALWYTDEMIAIQNPDSLAASFMVAANEQAAIPAVSFASLLEQFELETVDILKMDIEGAEKEIFSADTDWLKHIKLLIIELHDNYKPDCTKTFFKALEPFSYSAIFHHENIFIFFK